MKIEFGQDTYRNCVVAITVMMAVFAMKMASSVLLPIVAAGFIYVVFYPCINRAFKRDARPWLVTGIFFAILVLALALFLFVAASMLDRIISMVSEYAELADQVYGRVLLRISGRFGVVLHAEGDVVAQMSQRIVAHLRGEISSLPSLISSLTLILIYDFFLFAGHGKIRNMTLMRVKERRAVIAMELTVRQISRYIGVKFLVSVMTAVLFLAIMAFNGMNGALVLSGLALILNFIPTIGSVVATLMVSALAFLQFGASSSLLPAFVITVLCTLTQFVIGNLVDPFLTGKRLRLSPLAILASLAFWGYIWGVIGMVLAVPITSVIRNFFKYAKKAS